MRCCFQRTFVDNVERRLLKRVALEAGCELIKGPGCRMSRDRTVGNLSSRFEKIRGARVVCAGNERNPPETDYLHEIWVAKEEPRRGNNQMRSMMPALLLGWCMWEWPRTCDEPQLLCTSTVPKASRRSRILKAANPTGHAARRRLAFCAKRGPKRYITVQSSPVCSSQVPKV